MTHEKGRPRRPAGRGATIPLARRAQGADLVGLLLRALAGGLELELVTVRKGRRGVRLELLVHGPAAVDLLVPGFSPDRVGNQQNGARWFPTPAEPA